MVRYWLQFVFIACINCIPAWMQAQGFRYKQYTTHDGLPIDNVYAAAQDEDGIIWFGTNFGISKFDGNRFINFNKNSGITNKAVTDIVYAGADSMIFLSYPNTIQSIHTSGRITTVAECMDFSLEQLVRHNNNFYFYHRTVGAVGMLENGHCKILKLDSVFNGEGIKINSIFSIQNKGVGFCTNKGLYIQNNGQIMKYLKNQNVSFALYTLNKTIVVVSNNRIINADSNLNFSSTNFILPSEISVCHMAEEQDGTIWLRGLDKGIYRLQNNRIQEMSNLLGLKNKIVNEFFVDNEGTTWFCADGSGILVKQKNAFRNYETEDGLVNNQVLKLLNYNNKLIIGTSNGVSVKNGDKIRALKLPVMGRGLKYVYELLHINNTIGICISESFHFNYNTNNGTPGNIKKQKLDGYNFTAIDGFAGWQQNSNTVWIMYDRNLIRLVNNKIDRFFQLASLRVRKVYDITYFGDGVWFGTDNGIISFYQDELDKIMEHHDGKELGQVFQFLHDKKGNFWAATENGLLLYRQGEWNFVAKGSTYGSNYCKALTEDKEGNIWCATWDGIFVTDGNKRTSFGTGSGLASKTCNAILFDSATNELYIGTDNGLSVIKKDKLIRDINFKKVFIECIVNDSLRIDNGNVLKSFQNNLRFYLSLPYYNGNDEINFEYKLDDGIWVTKANPIVLLTDVDGGKHNLYARAYVNGGLITRADTIFTFIIRDPFYKTWWFWLVAVILVQLIIVWVIGRYNKKLREKKIAAQQQQAELASLKQQAFTSLMNPHFIFNALNSIQHYINKQDRITANKYLSDFATLVRRSFDTAQKAFVPLDEELETVRLYLQLEKMRFADKFNYTITLNKEAETEEWMLPGMVLQPFLENAVLHGLSPLSNNGLLNIDINAADNILYITITDNGIGMERSRLFRKEKKHNSRGMQLIQERLQILSRLSPAPIQLTISENTPGAENPGTRIQLVVPQQVYELYVQSTAAMVSKQRHP